ncbi:POU domain, class 6, transcription factor 2-like [Durio zibethinus]|uniref:POU domain, class 6, transcription factor 2-like n=1 Tax=Durio zibethinus TaxID=66656 RepID=A0A6P6BJ37_DURZI|nr:POU domain, class 6, transcription factor 2-like [Durio zibethinus]
MMQPTYPNSDFPPFQEFHKDQYKHIPKIPTPTDRDEYGNQKSVSHAKASRIITLDQELRYMTENNTGFTYAFTEREKEMKSLKIQLVDIQNQFHQKQQQQQQVASTYTPPPFQPYNPPTSPPKPFFTPFQYKPPPTSIPTSSQPTQYFTPISDQPEQPPFGTTKKWIHRFREKQPVDPKPKRVAEQRLSQPSKPKPKPSSSSTPQNPTPQPNQKPVQLMISSTQTLLEILHQMAQDKLL